MKYYAVVKSRDPSLSVALKDLSEYVNDYIQSEWEPIGGVQVLKSENDFISVQAMVKR